ncbi:MAG: hypothetical protein QOD58_4026 [Mycobacterium sp.]|nr:hypothetical protein [Mycobacterium sp.]
MIGVSYPLRPVSREEATANCQKASARAKWLFMLTTFGAIGVAAAIGFVVSDVSAAPAWIALAIGGVAVAAGYAGLPGAMRDVRYRITVLLSSLRLVLILALAVVAIWAVGSAHLIQGRVAKTFIIVVLVGALSFHLSTSTLFIGDCNGLTFRKMLVRWDFVSQVVMTAGAKPNTIEIGVRLVSGAKLESMPAKDAQVLTDLPFRTVVPHSKFDTDRMVWVLNQSGRQDIVLLERTGDGEKVLAAAGPALR